MIRGTAPRFMSAVIQRGTRKTFNQNAVAPTRPFNVDVIRRIKIQDRPINGYARVIATYTSDSTSRIEMISPHGRINTNGAVVTHRSGRNESSSQRFETPFVRSAFVFSYNPILHFSSSLSRALRGLLTSSSRRQMLPEILPPPSARHVPKETVRPKPFCYRTMTTKTAASGQNEISGKYREPIRTFMPPN